MRTMQDTSMVRPKKKIPCPHCNAAGYTLDARCARSMYEYSLRKQRQLEGTLETPEQALERISTQHYALSCTVKGHPTGCNMPRSSLSMLLDWLRRHKYAIQCVYCGGSKKVHLHRVVEDALKKETP